MTRNEDQRVRVRLIVDEKYRTQWRRLLATLIRLLGDFDLAEVALQEPFAAALAQWDRDGVPANPDACTGARETIHHSASCRSRWLISRKTNFGL